MNTIVLNTKKYHVFAPMGRFQLESIYLYFIYLIAGTTVENKGKLILTIVLDQQYFLERQQNTLPRRCFIVSHTQYLLFDMWSLGVSKCNFILIFFFLVKVFFSHRI